MALTRLFYASTSDSHNTFAAVAKVAIQRSISLISIPYSVANLARAPAQLGALRHVSHSQPLR